MSATHTKVKKPLFHRYVGNPILKPEQWSHTVNAMFNAGAVKFNGETLLLARVEDRSGISHLRALSD